MNIDSVGYVSAVVDGYHSDILREKIEDGHLYTLQEIGDQHHCWVSISSLAQLSQHPFGSLVHGPVAYTTL